MVRSQPIKISGSQIPSNQKLLGVHCRTDMGPAQCGSVPLVCLLAPWLHASFIYPIITHPFHYFSISIHISSTKFDTMGDSSNTRPRLRLLFDTALNNYEKRTGLKLIDHPLSRQLENCHTVDPVMAILQHQAWAFARFLGDDGKITRSLEWAVRVLHALSTNTTLKEGVGPVHLAQI